MMAGKLLTGLLRPFRSDGFQTAGRRTEQLTLALHERLSLKLILARHGVVISRDGTPLLASCRKQIRKLPKIQNSEICENYSKLYPKIIQYYSIVSLLGSFGPGTSQTGVFGRLKNIFWLPPLTFKTQGFWWAPGGKP